MPLLEDLESIDEGEVSKKKPKTRHTPIVVEVEKEEDTRKVSGTVNFPIKGKANRKRYGTTDDLFLA